MVGKKGGAARLLGSLLVMLGVLEAGAGTLYKCVTPEGKTAFQDIPCQSQARSEVISATAPRVVPLPRMTSPSQSVAPDVGTDEPRCSPPPDLKQRSSTLEHQLWARTLLRIHEAAGFHREQIESAPVFGEQPRPPSACDVLGKRYLVLKGDIEAMSPYQFAVVRSCLMAREHKLAAEKGRLGCR